MRNDISGIRETVWVRVWPAVTYLAATDVVKSLLSSKMTTSFYRSAWNWEWWLCSYFQSFCFLSSPISHYLFHLSLLGALRVPSFRLQGARVSLHTTNYSALELVRRVLDERGFCVTLFRTPMGLTECESTLCYRKSRWLCHLLGSVSIGCWPFLLGELGVAAFCWSRRCLLEIDGVIDMLKFVYRIFHGFIWSIDKFGVSFLAVFSPHFAFPVACLGHTSVESRLGCSTTPVPHFHRQNVSTSIHIHVSFCSLCTVAPLAGTGFPLLSRKSGVFR